MQYDSGCLTDKYEQMFHVKHSDGLSAPHGGPSKAGRRTPVSFQSVESQMVILFLGIVLGFIARKASVMNDRFDGQFSKLVLNVTLPCLIISSVLMNDELPDASTVGLIFLLSCTSYAIILAIAFAVPFLLRFPKDKRGTYSFMIAFGNVGFIGFPVLSAIFGDQAILYAAIFNIPFNLLVFTVGVFMISEGEGTLRERLTDGAKHVVSPTLISCFVALALALLRITEPGILGQSLDVMGQMTTPAALLIIGSTLAKMPIREMISSFRPYIASLFRLVFVPVAIFFVFRSFVTDPMLLGTIVITSGMPVATNGTLLCLQYGGDLKTMTKGTFVSTIMSLITIPLLAMMLVYL